MRYLKRVSINASPHGEAQFNFKRALRCEELLIIMSAYHGRYSNPGPHRGANSVLYYWTIPLSQKLLVLMHANDVIKNIIILVFTIKWKSFEQTQSTMNVPFRAQAITKQFKVLI